MDIDKIEELIIDVDGLSYRIRKLESCHVLFTFNTVDEMLLYIILSLLGLVRISKALDLLRSGLWKMLLAEIVAQSQLLSN
jgi:hypothetical protein